MKIDDPLSLFPIKYSDVGIKVAANGSIGSSAEGYVVPQEKEVSKRDGHAIASKAFNARQATFAAAAARKTIKGKASPVPGTISLGEIAKIVRSKNVSLSSLNIQDTSS